MSAQHTPDPVKTIASAWARSMSPEAWAEYDRLRAINADLLAALEELLGDPGWGCDRPTYLKAKAAIAKARGRS